MNSALSEQEQRMPIEELIEAHIASSKMIIDRFSKHHFFERDFWALKDYAWRMKTKLRERDLTEFPLTGEFMQNIFSKGQELRSYAKERLPEKVYWAIYS